jgi:hypothetical protein
MTLLLVVIPLLSDRASIPREPLGLPGVGFGVQNNETCPVGVPVAPEPGATLLLTPIGVPWATLIEETAAPLALAVSVVADGWNVMEDQLLTRFCALTDPSPVAMS